MLRPLVHSITRMIKRFGGPRTIGVLASMVRMYRLTALIAMLVVLLATSAAHAKSGVIWDCADDEVLQGRYTQSELRDALAKLDADADEYTNCREVIRNAQLALGADSEPTPTPTPGGGVGTEHVPDPSPEESRIPGTFGGFAGAPDDPVAGTMPQERAAIERARIAAVGYDPVALFRTPLPAPMVVALAVGGLALLIMFALNIRGRVGGRRDP